MVGLLSELLDGLLAPSARGAVETHLLACGDCAAYLQQLREKVRNLVGKAIRMYEETLSVAQRTGAGSGYVKKTEEALERLRKLMLDRG